MQGNTKECSNYHTIGLISHASKVMPRPQTHFLRPLPGVWGGVPRGMPYAPTPNLMRLIKEEGGGPSHGGRGVRPGHVPRLPGRPHLHSGLLPLQAGGRCLPRPDPARDDVMTHCAGPGWGRLARLCHLVPASWSAPPPSGLHRTHVQRL